jgi:hypothetical protein
MKRKQAPDTKPSADAHAKPARTPTEREIRVIDTTLRDAHQCLWATRMRTAHMLPVLDRFDRVGFESVDLMGTIQFDVCVRYLKENPWERVRLVHAGAPFVHACPTADGSSYPRAQVLFRFPLALHAYMYMFVIVLAADHELGVLHEE